MGPENVSCVAYFRDASLSLLAVYCLLETVLDGLLIPRGAINNYKGRPSVGLFMSDAKHVPWHNCTKKCVGMECWRM